MRAGAAKLTLHLAGMKLTSNTTKEKRERSIEDRQADRRRGEKKETRREKEDRQPTTGSVDSTRSHKLRVDALEAGGRNSDARRRLPGHLTATTQKQGRNVA